VVLVGAPFFVGLPGTRTEEAIFMDIIELRLKAKAAHDELEAMLKVAMDEGRGLTDEEKKDYDERKISYEALKDLVEKAEEAEKEAKRLAEVVTDPETPAPETPAGEERANPDIKLGEDREAKKPFESFGEQLRAVAAAASPENQTIDKRLLGIHEEARATGMSESVPSDGGFLVQKDYVPGILEKVYSTGSLISRVDILPIGANSNGVKLNAIDETSRADGSRMGGVRAYWKDEAALKVESKPKFRQMELNLNKVIGLVYSTDELLQDATALGAWVMKNLPIELRFKVEDAIVNGTGVGQPLGILVSGCLVSVAAETGQLANTIVYENLVKMYARHYSGAPDIVQKPEDGSVVWLINRDVIPQLFTMGLTVGVGGAPVFIPANGAAGRPYNEILGLPILPVEYCASLGTVGDIILVDLDEYQMIDKGGIQSAMSIHVMFIYDESVFRFVYRVDGQPKWTSALTPYKGAANTLSPFVALATRP